MQVETICVLPQIVLKDLGIDLRADSLHLRDEQVQLVTAFDPQSREKVFLAMLDHPFTGRHFTDFLGTVAPKGRVGFGSESATQADFAMPTAALATQQPQNESQRRRFQDTYNLHMLHSLDPDIGSAYQSFITDNFHFWNQVTNNKGLNNLLWYAGQTTLFRDRDTFGKQLFSHWVRRSASFLVSAAIESTLAKYQREQFIDFVHQQKGYEDTRPFRGDNLELVKNYLMQLSEKEQIAFGFTHALSSKDMFSNIWIDTTQRHISAGYEIRIKQVGKGSFFIKFLLTNKGVTIRFLDGASVSVDDSRGTIINIEALRKSIFRGFSDYRRLGENQWHVRGYQFSEDVKEAGLYPVVAVAVSEDGSKRFLTQQEARGFLETAQIPHASHGDVAAGKALLVYAKPSIAKGWDKAMFLKHQRQVMPMNIGNAQVGVWVSLDSEKYPHATQLLADTNGFLTEIIHPK